MEPTTTLVYVGPHGDGVRLTTGQTARPGKPLDVPEALATQLLEQPVFELAGGPDRRTKPQLAKALKAAGLDTSGSRDELLGRLLAHEATTGDAAGITTDSDPADDGQEG